MSLRFSDINDYIGKLNLDLHDPNVQTEFESVGSDAEEDYLRDLLDDKLYNELIADLDGNNDPQTQKFIDLMDGKTYNRESGKEIKFDGLKKMLRYFIYYEWIVYTWSNNTGTGQVLNVNENSEKVNRAELRKDVSLRYNEGVRRYNLAFQYINDEYETYFDTSTNDYSFWSPKNKSFKGGVKMGTPSNRYFYKSSSKGN
jgi:hypothetical protein